MRFCWPKDHELIHAFHEYCQNENAEGFLEIAGIWLSCYANIVMELDEDDCSDLFLQFNSQLERCKRGFFTGGSENFPAYFNIFCRNLCLNHRKRKRRVSAQIQTQPLFREARVKSFPSSRETPELENLLDELRMLPSKLRVYLILKYGLEMENKDMKCLQGLVQGQGFSLEDIMKFQSEKYSKVVKKRERLLHSLHNGYTRMLTKDSPERMKFDILRHRYIRNFRKSKAGLTTTEIAKITGKSWYSVNRLLQAALRILKTRLFVEEKKAA